MTFRFITGGAGTGKSHTLREMISNDYDQHVVCAPTGIAALNCGGSTVHSAFRIDPSTGFVSPKIKYGPLRGARRLYLDEVSMISADLMKSIYSACDMLGIEEVIAFGDLAQLKPVRGGWFFELVDPDQVDKLTKNYRQGSDLEFAGILNDIRNGSHRSAHIDYINQVKSGEGGMVLAFTNENVNRINELELAKLEGDPTTYSAIIVGNIKPDDVPAPMFLQLKPGASVIMLTNDMDKRWQNGSRATVVECQGGSTVDQALSDKDSEVLVEVRGERHWVTPHRFEKRTPETLTQERREYWEEIARNGPPDCPLHHVEHYKAAAEHTLANGYEMRVVGSFTQLPIKLGYASTVHKSQGLTLDHVQVMPDGFSSSHGIGYVALSRLTSLGGLSSTRPFRISDFYCNPKVLRYL